MRSMEKARFYNPRTGETEEIDVEYYAGEFSEEDFWSKIKSKINNRSKAKSKTYNQNRQCLT